jgi:hypothetical protein
MPGKEEKKIKERSDISQKTFITQKMNGKIRKKSRKLWTPSP